MSESISRRSFLRRGAVAAAGITIAPSAILGKQWGHTAPTDKLNIAGIGVGGMGFGNLKRMENENIVALCDVDFDKAKQVFERYPNAKKYWDFRKMYEEMGNSIDAVMVATPDHTHCISAAQAMVMGKHAYVQKPLTHTVYESRLLTKLADKYKISTQMGNQGASGEGVRQVCDWIWNGEIGEVTKVEAFTDRPLWPQGISLPKGKFTPKKNFDWNLFLGPCHEKPYNPAYHPWAWRGWWDFGTGALGDMACHILHPVFKGLKLGYPTKVQGSSTMLLADCAPHAQTVKLTFPARDNMPKVSMPEVEIFWYDGGLKPPRPEGVPIGKNLNDDGGGVIFHGTKDTLICGCYGVRPWLVSGRVPKAPKTQREITVSHEEDWIRACKESPANRIKPASDFSEAGPFNEMVVMGVLAVRLQELNRILEWDGEKMEFTNISDNDTMKFVTDDGLAIIDGHPKFNKKYTEPIPAKQFAAELIKHTYRDGWTLPEMPK